MLTKDDLAAAIRPHNDGTGSAEFLVEVFLDTLLEKMESVHGREELRQIRGEEGR
jgi:hypothetical protein